MGVFTAFDQLPIVRSLLSELSLLYFVSAEPFVGSHYDNIFIHYKPVSGWDYGWL
jgi:hypothetical protein